MESSALDNAEADAAWLDSAMDNISVENPLRARVVEIMEDITFSSYRLSITQGACTRCKYDRMRGVDLQ